jgi:hypothetical protein
MRRVLSRKVLAFSFGVLAAALIGGWLGDQQALADCSKWKGACRSNCGGRAAMKCWEGCQWESCNAYTSLSCNQGGDMYTDACEFWDYICRIASYCPCAGVENCPYY